MVFWFLSLDCFSGFSGFRLALGCSCLPCVLTSDCFALDSDFALSMILLSAVILTLARVMTTDVAGPTKILFALVTVQLVNHSLIQTQKLALAFSSPVGSLTEMKTVQYKFEAPAAARLVHQL